MLSREDRILSELIVSRDLAAPEVVERRARELEDSDESGLVEALVHHGELDADTGRRVREEAREIDDLLNPELPEGKTLGEFRLVREIGRGGMGIVYEAEQTSLGRRVALKVLPAGAALDERLAIRFVREARSAARLDHPGIVSVFGTGREQGVLFFAMELVLGESLATRIDRGPLTPREAARIAREIAAALQHAHDAGLVHRDVKPDNVILDESGRARLTDFGLVHDVHGARLTRSQYVLGTPAYTAPEQARGAAADPRCDVYAAGAVLYAMLSGSPPFTGEVPAAVLARLVNEPPPPLGQLAPGTPRELITICERAMARDATERYPTAGAFADALEGYLDGWRGAPAASQLTRSRGRRTLVAAAVVFGTLVAMIWLFERGGLAGRAANPRPGEAAGLLRGTHRLFPTSPEMKKDLALSPDGETLAYVSVSAAGIFTIHLQRAGEEARRLVPGEGHQTFPVWSADGSRIAYCASGVLSIVDVSSQAVESAGVACSGPSSWSPDGRRIVYEDRVWPMTRLRILDLATRTSSLISGPGTFQPSWGPGGRIAHVAMRDGQYDVWTFREDGSDATRVTDDTAREMSPVWSSIPGRLHFGSNLEETFDLWQVDLDADTGRAHSPPVPVSRGWFWNAFTLSAARDRERLAFIQDVDVARFWALPLDRHFEPAGAPRRLAADLPFESSLPERAPHRDEWITAVRRGDAHTLHRFGSIDGGFEVTAGPYRDGAPRWSPDGTTIAFDSDRSGRSEIWTVRPDGTRLSQLTRASGAARSPVWSPDGARLIYSVEDRGPGLASLTGGEERLLDTARGFEGFVPWSWSGDGERIAGTCGGIAVLDLASGGYTRVTAFGQMPVWVGEARTLLFTHDDRVWSWDGEREPRVIWSAEPNRLASGLSVGFQGGEIYFASSGAPERIWLLDLDSSLKE